MENPIATYGWKICCSIFVMTSTNRYNIRDTLLGKNLTEPRSKVRKVQQFDFDESAEHNDEISFNNTWSSDTQKVLYFDFIVAKEEFKHLIENKYYIQNKNDRRRT